MADNTTLDAGSGGDTIAADDIGGVKYQRAKLIHGADGVNAGDVSMANGLPVQPATSAAFPVTDNGSTLSVDDGGGSLTVDGNVTVTATNLSTNVAQYGGSAVGATNAVHVQAGTGATFPITDNSGSITVDNGGTFAVQAAQSGTWNVATLTSITNVVHVDDNSSTLSVDDGGGSLTVDGTVAISGTVTVGSHAVTNAGTFAVQVDGAALTALQLIDDVVVVEDAAHVSGDKGVMALAVRRDANTTLADTTGDYAPLQVDATGSLKVAIISGAGSGGTASTDQGTFTASTTSGTPAMGAYDDTGPSTMTEDKLGILRMTAYRGLHVNLRDASGAEVSVGGGTQYDEDAAHVSGSKVTGAGIVRKDTAASLCGTDGDYTMPIADASGKLWVNAEVTVALPAGTNAIGKLAANSGVDIGDVDVTSVTPGTTASALGKAEDAAHTTGDVGVAVLAVRRDSPVVSSGTDGDYSTINVDANGRLYVACDTHAVTQSGTWNVGTVTTVTTVTTVSTVTAVSDAQVQGKAAHDAAASGSPILQGGYASAAAPTDVSADADAVRAWYLRNGAAACVLTAAGALIGGDATNGLDVDVTRLPALAAGSNEIGGVNVTKFSGTAADTNSGNKSAGTLRVVLATDQPALTTAQPIYLNPQTSGGLTISRTISAASTNATSVKASAGQVYGWFLSNSNAAARYLKLYNKATSPTVGTDTPVMTVMIPAGAAANVEYSQGIAFGTGIALALTTGATDADTAAVAANEIIVNLLYK